jgi:hypothetical protein
MGVGFGGLEGGGDFGVSHVPPGRWWIRGGERVSSDAIAARSLPSALDARVPNEASAVDKEKKSANRVAVAGVMTRLWLAGGSRRSPVLSRVAAG